MVHSIAGYSSSTYPKLTTHLAKIVIISPTARSYFLSNFVIKYEFVSCLFFYAFSFKVGKNLGLVELQKAKSSFGLITLKELKTGEIFCAIKHVCQGRLLTPPCTRVNPK